jgi:hypothetical protein
MLTKDLKVEYSCIAERIQSENAIREKIDTEGKRWWKIYFGSGAHFKNWLRQCIEIFGKENIEVEEIGSSGLKCFDEGDEKVYRIWKLEK